MHIVPAPLVRAACHAIAHVDAASAVALQANDLVVSSTIDAWPQVSSLSILAVREFDRIGSLLIGLVVWMIENVV